ncbi:MAG: aspartyl protease family protein [Candidatus Bathyarchaeia archaeon]
MKIIGRLGERNLGNVTAILYAPTAHINTPIRFYVDTGASATTICDRDAQRARVDYSHLRKVKAGIRGIGGDIDAYILPHCWIIFEFSKENSTHIEYLDNVVIMKHKQHTNADHQRVRAIPSLLGLDVLRKYTVSFSNNHVILEK